MTRRSDLRELLEEQKGFLERSNTSFDEGYLDEAKRIAVTIRVLYHDTRTSHSLIKQLGYQDYMLIDTCPELVNSPPGKIFQAGLAVPSLQGYRPRHEMPSRVTQPLWTTFNYWWNDKAVVKTLDRTFSRKDLVLLLANKEGGAHVDPKLNASYEKLKNKGSGMYVASGDEDPVPMTKEEHACLRQISYEVLETLEAILAGEALVDDHDERPMAFRFPIYVFVKADGDTPLRQVRIATIEALGRLMPVFDDEAKADLAATMLVGDYQKQKLGLQGFIRFLKGVVLPQGIEYLTMNPDVASEENRRVETISVMSAIDNLENMPLTDDEIEEKIQRGELKKL